MVNERMQYQTFRGSDVVAALVAVRQALGDEALIGNTRHVNNGKCSKFCRDRRRVRCRYRVRRHGGTNPPRRRAQRTTCGVSLPSRRYSPRGIVSASRVVAGPRCQPSGGILRRASIDRNSTAVLEHDLPLTYLCDSARVPEDIHDAAVERVLDALFPGQT